eukprot:6618948-Lingulodinium_polyedra.AAC.1
MHLRGARGAEGSKPAAEATWRHAGASILAGRSSWARETAFAVASPLPPTPSVRWRWPGPPLVSHA